MDWIFNGQPFCTVPEDFEGFVYLITNITNNKKYIGKKSFWQRRKQKKTGRRKTLESDWKNYYSSSAQLLEDVKTHGKENFKREILFLCKHKKSMSFYEVREQFIQDVLLKDDWYNDNISGKFFANEKERIFQKIKTKDKNDEKL